MRESARDALTAVVRGTPALVPGVVVIAVVLVWSVRDGASDTRVWIPGGLIILGLLLVVAFAIAGAPSMSVAGLVATTALGAYVVWCYLSIAWADVESDAWSGANQTLVYLGCFLFFAIRPWTPRAAAAALTAYAVGIALIGTWLLLRIDAGRDPQIAFDSGRLSEPIAYANGNCALFVAASIPALLVAVAKSAPLVVRAACLASAGALVQFALLTQSRMSLLGVPIILVLLFTLVRCRVRLLLGASLVGVVVAASTPTLLDVYPAALGRQGLDAAVDEAQRALLASIAVLAAVGAGWSLVDRRVEVPARIVRAAGVLAVVILLAGGTVGAVTSLTRDGGPTDRAAVWWNRFKTDESVSRPDTPHLVSGLGGAGRYEIWSVAFRIFEESPVTGIGVDNFVVEWLRRRPNERDVTYPHSIELRLLQQTGVVGGLLFTVFLTSAVVAGWGGLRRRGDAQLASCAALLLGAYWLVHGSVDWLWEIPALTAVAFAALGLVVALGTGRRRALGVAPRMLLAVVAAAGVVSLLPAWLAERELRLAVHSADVAGQEALDHVDRARTLNPLSAEPDLVGALIASERADLGRQRALLHRALERNPHDWYPYVELGLVDARRGRRAAALRWLARAQALNPLEGAIRFSIARVRRGRPPSPEEMHSLFPRAADLCCRP
jgi:hypothetical protein